MRALLLLSALCALPALAQAQPAWIIMPQDLTTIEDPLWNSSAAVEATGAPGGQGIANWPFATCRIANQRFVVDVQVPTANPPPVPPQTLCTAGGQTVQIRFARSPVIDNVYAGVANNVLRLPHVEGAGTEVLFRLHPALWGASTVVNSSLPGVTCELLNNGPIASVRVRAAGNAAHGVGQCLLPSAAGLRIIPLEVF
jgi:hypothetical protein